VSCSPGRQATHAYFVLPSMFLLCKLMYELPRWLFYFSEFHRRPPRRALVTHAYIHACYRCYYYACKERALTQ
jgi:hypothetical protein